MTYQRTMILGGLLATLVGVAVASVGAQRPAPDQERGMAERSAQDDRARRDRDMVFLGPDGAGRRAIRLDGRGSQIGVAVSDPGAGTSGVRIDEVDDDSPAAKAGVREGDLVVEFDGERVRSARQLTRLVQETPEGRPVKMTITRDGARRSVDITPEASALAWNFQIDEPRLRAEIERGLRGRGPAFDFRFDDMPGTLGVPPGARGRLGVQVETLSDQLAEYFGVKGGGVLVSSVAADTPAQKAGLKAGDVITGVNGTAVRETRELMDEIRQAEDRREVRLDVVRDKRTMTVTATLERPAPRRPAI
jgi:serine protease Do